MKHRAIREIEAMPSPLLRKLHTGYKNAFKDD